MDEPTKLENNGLERNPDGTVKSGVLNPNGRPKRKTLTELIHDKLDKGDGDLDWNKLVAIVLTMASKKDKEIIKELWHYTDGMPKQSTDVTSGGKPLPILGGITKEKDE